jgi:hypothetical protein
MGSQKLRTFSHLWKDKRDTLRYYTFWGVIFFGSLSVIVAIISLAVSIAQTVASFKALEVAKLLVSSTWVERSIIDKSRAKPVGFFF